MAQTRLQAERVPGDTQAGSFQAGDAAGQPQGHWGPSTHSCLPAAAAGPAASARRSLLSHLNTYHRLSPAIKVMKL